MRVHIADDHDLILQGFEVLLKAHGINVVGTSLNGSELIQWFESNECDVLILDISMPSINGIEVFFIDAIFTSNSRFSYKIIFNYFKKHLRRKMRIFKA